MFAPHTLRIACGCVTAATSMETSVCVCAGCNDFARHGQQDAHATRKIAPPPLATSYLLSPCSSVMATGSVLECACSGNMCQGTDEPTRGTLRRSCSHLSAEEWFHKHRARCFLAACLSHNTWRPRWHHRASTGFTWAATNQSGFLYVCWNHESR